MSADGGLASIQETASRPLTASDKPLLRGRLHVFAASLCSVGCVWFTVTGNVSLSVALLMKTVVYAVSAHLHTHTFQSDAALERTHTLDLLAVPLSAVGSVAATVVTPFDAGFQTAIGASVFVANAAVVLPGTVGILRTPLRRDETTWHFVRIGILSLYVSYVVVRVGMHADLSVWYQVTLFVLMTVSLAAAAMVTALYVGRPSAKELAPWHRTTLWLAHEDMHLLVFVADMCWFALV